MKKIAITGTKGKTTVTYVISQVLQNLDYNVLRVDTTGHYVNGKQRSTLEDSKKTWGLVPSVSPGRYLYEFLTNPTLQTNGVAVLESSLGSSQLPGMGYRSHNVGVFLNVYEDHLGSSARLKTKSDIAIAKEFIFKKMERNGFVVFNADDNLVVRSLRVVPKHLDVTLIPCGIDFKYFDKAAHLKNSGQALTIKKNKVVLLKGSQTKILFDLKNIPWTFDGDYLPSVWNLMMAAGAILANNDGKWPSKASQIFESVRLDPYGGRLTLLRAKNGATIIADYAHEERSLVEVAKLARSLINKKGQVIGVTRLAVDRTDELIEKTGRSVGKAYDKLIVYDKIDGHYRKPRKVRSLRFPEVVGKVSEVYANSIKETNSNVERIVQEDKALKRANEIARPGDVVIYIVNDDVKRSIDFAKKYFKADFL